MAETVEKEIEGLEKEWAEDEFGVKEAKQEYESAASEATKAEDSVDGAFKSLVRNSNSLYNSVKQLGSAVKTSKQTLEEADPEKAAASIVEQGGAVGVGKALKLIEQEKIAKRKHKENESKYFRAASEYLGEMVSSGASVLWQMGGESISGVVDAAFSKEGAVTLAGGMVMGAVLGGSNAITDTVSDLVQGYIDLDANNELGDGVVAKVIAGLENKEQYEQYAQENANGEGYNAYASENGENGTAATKEVEASEGNGTSMVLTNNALDISDEELNKMADVDQYLSDQDEQQQGALLASVKEQDAPETPGVTGDEPDVPDIPDVPDYGIDDFQFA